MKLWVYTLYYGTKKKLDRLYYNAIQCWTEQDYFCHWTEDTKFTDGLMQIITTRRYILVYEPKDSYKVLYNKPSITTIQYKATLAVYVVLYNAMTLHCIIGLIGNVMACYGRKSKFADAS